MAKHDGTLVVCDRTDALATLLRSLRVGTLDRLENDQVVLVTVSPDGTDVLTFRY